MQHLNMTTYEIALMMRDERIRDAEQFRRAKQSRPRPSPSPESTRRAHRFSFARVFSGRPRDAWGAE